MAKILIVEDDKQLADMVRTALLFDHHLVELVSDGQTASIQLRSCEYELIVLDWGLPEKSGIDVCKEFRARGGKTPILMLTGKGDIADKETGLDAGADDYLAKPFHIRELAARVWALLRRPAGFKETTLTAGNLSLDPAKHRAYRDGQAVALLPKEFALLEFMMRHPNHVFSPEVLLDHVWPRRPASLSRNNLRAVQAGGDDRCDPKGRNGARPANLQSDCRAAWRLDWSRERGGHRQRILVSHTARSQTSSSLSSARITPASAIRR